MNHEELLRQLKAGSIFTLAASSEVIPTMILEKADLLFASFVRVVSNPSDGFLNVPSGFESGLRLKA